MLLYSSRPLKHGNGQFGHHAWLTARSSSEVRCTCCGGDWSKRPAAGVVHAALDVSSELPVHQCGQRHQLSTIAHGTARWSTYKSPWPATWAWAVETSGDKVIRLTAWLREMACWFRAVAGVLWVCHLGVQVGLAGGTNRGESVACVSSWEEPSVAYRFWMQSSDLLAWGLQRSSGRVAAAFSASGLAGYGSEKSFGTALQHQQSCVTVLYSREDQPSTKTWAVWFRCVIV